MTISRYARSPQLNVGAQYGTSGAVAAVRAALKQNRLSVKQVVVVRGSERLDTMAGVLYGDSRLWWVLAAASNVGWGLQVPVGTVITVPDLNEIAYIVG